MRKYISILETLVWFNALWRHYEVISLRLNLPPERYLEDQGGVYVLGDYVLPKALLITELVHNICYMSGTALNAWHISHLITKKSYKVYYFTSILLMGKWIATWLLKVTWGEKGEIWIWADSLRGVGVSNAKDPTPRYLGPTRSQSCKFGVTLHRVARKNIGNHSVKSESQSNILF